MFCAYYLFSFICVINVIYGVLQSCVLWLRCTNVYKISSK